jgi:TfoX/Sxy family transcriptional regulator of competence genes
VSYDAGLLQRCLDGIEQIGIDRVRTKPVFGMRGLLWADRMFAAVGDESIIVKLRREELDHALTQPGVTSFQPGGTTLGTWVEISDDAVADDPDLRSWLQAGLRALR